MAGIAVVPDPPKSSPDIGKLNGMTGRILTVTRHTTRTGPGSMVLSGQKGVSVDQINALHDTLPRQFGPGTYRFEVVEEGGSDRDVWTVKLGGGGPDLEIPIMTSPNGVPGIPAAGGGVIDLGHGNFYNPEFGLLTTREGVFEWRPGTPLPTRASPANMFGLDFRTGAQPTTMPGWGQIPATPTPIDDASKREIEALREQLRQQNDRQEREERRRADAEQRAMFEKAIADNNARTEALIKALTERPQGPPVEVIELRRQLETQQAEQRAREESARMVEATRVREEALRAEMTHRFEVLVSKMGDHGKENPMLSLLGQLLATQQTGAAEALRAISSSTQAQLSSAQSSALTPERMMQLMTTLSTATKGTNDEINKGFVDMFKQLFGMSKDMFEMQMRSMGEAAGPAWLGPVQQAMEKVGQIGQIYMATKAREQEARMRQTVAPVRQAVQQPGRVVGQGPPSLPAQRQAPVQPQQQPQQTASDARDAAAAKVFGPAAQQQAPNPPIKKRKGKAAAAAPAPEEAAASGDISALPTAEVKKVTDELTDEVLFSKAMPMLIDLRGAIEKGEVSTDKIVEFILQARTFFQGAGELPPCIELLNNGHIDILIDRLIPAANDIFRRQVADALRVALRAEDAGEVDEGEDESA